LRRSLQEDRAADGPVLEKLHKLNLQLPLGSPGSQ
jgi:hypothetical protein